MTKTREVVLKISASFCVAAFVAGSATYCAKAIKAQKEMENDNGMGGLEISAVPQYDTLDKIEEATGEKAENSTEEISLESEAEEARKDIYALEEAEKKLIDGGLYYISYRIKEGDMIGVIA